jgi:Ser/Thr protein kinase RdoA (MazF antagonist)
MTTEQEQTAVTDPGPRYPTPAEILRGYDPFASAALAAYGFSPAARLALLSLSENATYRVDDPADGRVAVLRVHRTGYHEPGAVQSELAWLTALRRDEGLRTPAVYPALDGREVVDVVLDGITRQTVLFELLPGAEPSADQLATQFERLGTICARMHKHALSWRRPPGFVRFSWDFDACVGLTGRWGRWQDGIGVGPAELDVLSRATAVMRERLAHVRHRLGAELHRARPASAPAVRGLAGRLPARAQLASG